MHFDSTYCFQHFLTGFFSPRTFHWLSAHFSFGNNSASAYTLTRNGDKIRQPAASVHEECIQSGASNCKDRSQTEHPVQNWCSPLCSAPPSFPPEQTGVSNKVFVPIRSRCNINGSVLS